MFPEREIIMVGGVAMEAGIQSKQLTDQIFNHKRQVERENWMGSCAMNSWRPTQWVLSPAAPKCLPKELHQLETAYSNIRAYGRQFSFKVSQILHTTLRYIEEEETIAKQFVRQWKLEWTDLTSLNLWAYFKTSQHMRRLLGLTQVCHLERSRARANRNVLVINFFFPVCIQINIILKFVISASKCQELLLLNGC